MARAWRTSCAPLLAAAAAAAVVVAVAVASSSLAAAEQWDGADGNDDLGQQEPPVAQGLSFDFYKQRCPKAESIVRDYVRDAVRKDAGIAAGLIRLHFHDCFVQGCDASVLLDGSATGPGEQQAPPNLTLRPSSFAAINAIRDRLEQECQGAIVSCSDIVALAARDSVVATGGPSYRVPLGRRDSPRFATRQDVLSGLPAPTSTVPALLAVLRNLNLDATDLVALSGGHTVGLGHCTSFENRLFPNPDPTMNPTFLSKLKQTCPVKGTDALTVLDVRTPDTFDNKYYVDLLNRQGLFTSDQDLYTNAATKPIVERFAKSQQAFFDQFSVSVVKMGQFKVLTGNQGQVRRNCSARNPGTVDSHLSWSSLAQTVAKAATETLGF